MATKAQKWHADFRKLMAPRLLKALKDDRAGRIPLMAKQRRLVRGMLLIVLTPAEIQKALKPTKSRQAARQRHRRAG